MGIFVFEQFETIKEVTKSELCDLEQDSEEDSEEKTEVEEKIIENVNNTYLTYNNCVIKVKPTTSTQENFSELFLEFTTPPPRFV